MPVTYAAYSHKKPVTQPKRVKGKPAWSDYLTADNKFALSSEEILRRKQTLLSRHNVFNSTTGNFSDLHKQSSATRDGKGLISNTQKLLDARIKKGNNNKPYYDDLDAEAFPKGDKDDMTALDLVSTRHKHWYVNIVCNG